MVSETIRASAIPLIIHLIRLLNLRGWAYAGRSYDNYSIASEAGVRQQALV